MTNPCPPLHEGARLQSVRARGGELLAFVCGWCHGIVPPGARNLLSLNARCLWCRKVLASGDGRQRYCSPTHRARGSGHAAALKRARGAG